ncbi:hypothetical protein [Streptomyces cucumeris]|uniref:hypothetical protein n=1 Tax=Streptomyces cucumeris TaxID=2962890 RepID=UPI0020C84302|nr:hypothetical protein [Streptomyces sp. NEAU-Y11]MCP9209564.1 hypothetical protein [Streptomyces sp. NEAU-Y11]
MTTGSGRSLTGLRVMVQREGGLIYGVARVRYNEGHTYAGNYEIETADGASLLAPFGDCMPGKNWDVTPREERFTGAEIFYPCFLDGSGRDFLARSPGVVVPGDMTQMRKLFDPVRKGWTVGWYSHGANEFRGTLTVVERRETAFVVTDGKNTRTYEWPTAREEFEVCGSTLHEVRVPPRRTGKHPSRSLSITVHRPRKGY